MTDTRNSDRKGSIMVMISKNPDELPGSHGLGKCCLCPCAIQLHEEAIILYLQDRPITLGKQTARAHLACFEQDPVRQFARMKDYLGYISPPSVTFERAHIASS